MVHAVLIRKTGPPDVLELVGDYEKPTIKDGEVLVRQVSTSVNPVDCKTREGALPPKKLPKVLGGDLAGFVEESRSSKWKKGDRVMALTYGYHWDNEDNRLGTYADYTASKEEWLAQAPKGILLNILGGVPLVALTAFQALESGHLKPGARVLVHAGAGGVGHFAVQLAKVHFKAYVVATAGPDNQKFVKEEMGADEVVNYKKEDFSEKYKDKPFDLVIDPIGGVVEDKSYTVLTEHGTYTHILNNNTDQKKVEAGKGWKERKYVVILVQPNGEQLQIISDHLEKDEITLIVDKIFWLKDIRAAHEYAEKEHKRGKVVVQISHEE
ncbi:NADPH-dependent alkenal/one oxidoreductase, chloroplastic [Coccomyxa sp. Obi]|nr:NADPH-dependent alkenal/one oxidoreductase, chloroplastic [Coccomyxa sp. Obi]